MNLRSRLLSTLAVTALTAFTLAAHATPMPITYDLENVNLFQGATPEGTLTGSFTVTGNIVDSYNIVASATGPFAGFDYNSTDSSVQGQDLPSFLALIDASNVNLLDIVFQGSLLSSGASINGSSFVDEFQGAGIRRIVGGTVVAETVATTPEPSSLVLLGTGLLGFAGMARRRFFNV